MCDCKPGTFENGWHEERSEECHRAEVEAFGRALTAAGVRMAEPTDPGPVVYNPPLTQAEGDAYWAAISDDPEPSEQEPDDA